MKCDGSVDSSTDETRRTVVAEMKDVTGVIEMMNVTDVIAMMNVTEVIAVQQMSGGEKQVM